MRGIKLHENLWMVCGVIPGSADLRNECVPDKSTKKYADFQVGQKFFLNISIEP